MRDRQLMKGSVSVCNRNACIHANGEFAELISKAAVMMLLLIGLGALLKAIR